MVRFLEGFDVREVIVGFIAFSIVAVTINFGVLQISHFRDFSNKIHYQKSHFDIPKGTTIQSIAVKVDSFTDKPLFRDTDIQLACSKQQCTVSFSSELSRGEALKAKKVFEALFSLDLV
jgi:hypothetical protein